MVGNCLRIAWADTRLEFNNDQVNRIGTSRASAYGMVLHAGVRCH